MKNNEDTSNMGYAERAFHEFNEIMANRHRHSTESINRPNQGELFVLKFLMKKDTEVLPSELSHALQSSTARISALLGALEKKGQIVRNIDESNRRNILVTITDVGRKRAKEEMQEMKKVMVQVFTDMGEEDAVAFIKLNRKFFDLMQKNIPKE